MHADIKSEIKAKNTERDIQTSTSKIMLQRHGKKETDLKKNNS